MILLGSTVGLNKMVQNGVRGASASAFFRSLHILYKNFPVLESEICRMIISIVTVHVHYSKHLVDFLNGLKAISAEKRDVINCLQENINNIDTERLYQNGKLQHYAYILNYVCQESSIKLPLFFIGKILQSSKSCSWSDGCTLLSVCKEMIINRVNGDYNEDILKILLFICENYDDTDIRDRAKFYYELLTSLTIAKLRKLFDMSGEEKTDQLAEIVLKKSEPLSAYTFAESSFELLRHERLMPQRTIYTDVQEDKECSFDINEYQQFTSDVGSAYCVQLQFSTPTFCSIIEDVKISHLTMSNEESKTEKYFAFVLPDCKHLFLRLEIVGGSYVAHSVTDSESILGHLESFLSSIFEI
ncbi:DgyrCDS11446 [Dimorphilus gyrociliatus]|uniref:DgyrCDS11446 n=1 Tax=Dimorphilus gyrociliatus TaxID=2664684 RepID=A0A7I8W584_9ANNE|nr:DgyrCDS11446 [Dimorphilus gyrociliatus]